MLALLLIPLALAQSPLGTLGQPALTPDGELPGGCGDGHIDIIMEMACASGLPGRDAPCHPRPRALEECDGADLGQSTCHSQGWLGGTLACDDSCHLIHEGCVASQSPQILRRIPITEGRPVDALLHEGAVLALVEAGTWLELRSYAKGSDTPELVARRSLRGSGGKVRGVKAGQLVRTSAGLLMVTTQYSPRATEAWLLDEEGLLTQAPGQLTAGLLESLTPSDEGARLITTHTTGSTAIPRSEWTLQAWATALSPTGEPVGEPQLVGELPRHPHSHEPLVAMGLLPEPRLTGLQRELSLDGELLIRHPSHRITSRELQGEVGIVTTATERHHARAGTGEVWVISP